MLFHRSLLPCWLFFLACQAPEPEPVVDAPPFANAASEQPAPNDVSTAGTFGASGATDGPELPPSDGGQGGSGAGPAFDPACAAPEAHVAELLANGVRPGARVGLDRLVATSGKFLLYRSKSEGTCLWGVYAAEPSAERHHGILLVAYGAPAVHADAACPLGSDAIPDDIAPGALVLAQGEVASFRPSSCDAVAPSVQVRLDSRCPLVVTARGAELAPIGLDAASASAIAAGDARSLAVWAGALVELEGVAARPVPGESDAVAPFGVIQLEETPLEIHDALAFTDLRRGGPGDPSKAFAFGYPTEFARVRGIVHLDYCTWSLAPRDECSDFSPSSAGCAR